MKGFTMIEVLFCVAAISVLCGVGMVTIRKTQEIGTQHKLQSDVATINSAVTTYLNSGGTIPDDATPQTVLELLKKSATAENTKTVVGVSGALIDPRIRGVEETEGENSRAVWNPDTKRFVITSTGEGFGSFTLDNALSQHTFGTDSRSTHLQFSQNNGWVWDYNSETVASAAQAPAEFDVGTNTPAAFAGQSGTNPVRLRPPTPSIVGGLFSLLNLPAGTLLTNPNEAGSSEIYYTLNNGSWKRYTVGQLIALPANLLESKLVAYAASNDTDRWLDSPNNVTDYKVIFFSGLSDGNFRKPAGDNGLVTNLTNNLKGKLFTWGTPAAGQVKPNSLTFTPNATFNNISPDQEFLLGKIDYYNGTTNSGTNATSVKLQVTLTFTVPGGSENLEFTLNLQSTPNNGRSADEDADYVWIPAVASQFSTKIHGQTFYLKLRFGNSTANGFTTINEFHVHENKTASGSIYGKFTTTP